MISKKLIELRKAKGWTQQKVAKETGIPRAMISRYEIDTIPREDNMKKITDAFGLPEDYFFSIATENKKAFDFALDPIANRMISDLLELPKEQQTVIYSMIQTLSEKSRSKAGSRKSPSKGGRAQKHR